MRSPSTTPLLSPTLFITVFYIDIQYRCDNAFPNLNWVNPEPYFLEKVLCQIILKLLILVIQIEVMMIIVTAMIYDYDYHDFYYNDNDNYSYLYRYYGPAWYVVVMTIVFTAIIVAVNWHHNDLHYTLA